MHAPNAWKLGTYAYAISTRKIQRQNTLHLYATVCLVVRRSGKETELIRAADLKIHGLHINALNALAASAGS